jgi:stress-induced morphogen
MSPDHLKQRIETLAEKTTAHVTDLTGTQDHYQVLVHSPVFQGKGTLQCHRMVLDLVQTEIDSGELHAISLKCSPL